MASGTFYPAVSGDDGYWRSGEFQAVADYLFLGHDNYHSQDLHSFIRFLNVTIPTGATITSAFIRFTANRNDSVAAVNLKLSFNDIDNAVAPTSIAEADALVLTTAKVDWNNIAAWTDGNTYDTPSIITIMQEVIDRGSWSSGNAMMGLVKDNGSSGPSHPIRSSSAIDYLSGAEKAELHVEWTPAITAEITEDVGIADTYASVVLAAIIAEAFGLSDSCVFETPYREITDGCGINDTLVRSFETFNSITDGVSIADAIVGIFEIFVSITDSAGIADAYAKFIEINKSIQDDLSSDDLHEVIRLYNKTIVEALSSWDTLKWSWSKSVADSLAITETIAKRLGIPVRDWLTLTDIETTNWSGVEAISDSFYVIDISKAIRVYVDAIADGVAITDAVNLALEMMITDILTYTDTVLNIGTFQYSITDSLTLEDIVRRAFPKSVSDSFVVTDTSLVDFLVLLRIVDALIITETTTPGFTISQTIADALEVLDTAAIQQLLQELIQDGLNIEVIIELDDELWQTWVLNTGAFHPSVYSGYDYNSFAVFGETVYGCKSDGIYELAGDTDDGTAFKSGIILPSTQFGSTHNRRFRKGFLGVSGDNVVLKAETENGWQTFRVTDTEVSITRDLKGRSWKFSVEGFDSLDSIDLIPIILSR